MSRWNADRSVSVEILKTLKIIHHVILDLLEIEKVELKIDSTLALESPSVTDGWNFFEDFTLPPINWEVTQKELLETYQPKVMKDITEGKIKPGKHEFGETDWIEVL